MRRMRLVIITTDGGLPPAIYAFPMPSIFHSESIGREILLFGI